MKHFDTTVNRCLQGLALRLGLTFSLVCLFGLLAAQDTLSGPKWRLRGSIQVRTAVYQAEGIPPRYPSFTWVTQGAPVLYAGNVSIPIRFQWGNWGINRYGQPFNKAGIAPKGKWWQLHLGHSNLNWSPFVLGGRTLFGAGFEINPGRFRFGAVYGKLQNSVEEFTDTVLLRPPLILFERRAYGFKIGVGKKHRHVDLLFLKGQDDTLSVRSTEIPARSMPQENMVIGLQARLRPARFWYLDLDGAGSAYTRNMYSMPTDLDDNTWSRALTRVFVPRLASRYNYAGEAALRFQKPVYGLEFRYKRVDTDYQSMGAYFLQNDVEMITGTAKFQHKKGKYSAGATFGWQRNNLASMRAHQTSRRIGRLHARYSASPSIQWHVQYHNLTTDLKRRRELLDDTLALNQQTHHTYAGMRWFKTLEGHQHLLTTEVFMRNLSGVSPEYRSLGGQVNYQWSRLGSGPGLQAGCTVDRYRFGSKKYLRVQSAIGLQYRLGTDKLLAQVRLQQTSNFFESVLETAYWAPVLSVTGRLSKGQTLQLYATYIRSNGIDTALYPDFSETRAELTYSVYFN